MDGWFSFLGGYFGVIGAIGGIWWQLNEERERNQSKKEEEIRKKQKKILTNFSTLFRFFKLEIPTSKKTFIDYFLCSQERLFENEMDIFSEGFKATYTKFCNEINMEFYSKIAEDSNEYNTLKNFSLIFSSFNKIFKRRNETFSHIQFLKECFSSMTDFSDTHLNEEKKLIMCQTVLSKQINEFNSTQDNLKDFYLKVNEIFLYNFAPSYFYPFKELFESQLNEKLPFILEFTEYFLYKVELIIENTEDNRDKIDKLYYSLYKIKEYFEELKIIGSALEELKNIKYN